MCGAARSCFVAGQLSAARPMPASAQFGGTGTGTKGNSDGPCHEPRRRIAPGARRRTLTGTARMRTDSMVPKLANRRLTCTGKCMRMQNAGRVAGGGGAA